MAIIEWTGPAWQLYNDMLEYAREEFGETTFRCHECQVS